ncbi:FG-GAP repeat protein [Actinomadura alba]|uniref:FG-GAP repeat protein n=1 Tax=Actinomadura alba TaxID=406431 RepID=A0ABR7LPF3_9ACTN|nr:FG-GAP repeat protein [Actinomadura alba]MBC6466729.1 FG-GAP repeat protein [Actinomadura alba]
MRLRPALVAAALTLGSVIPIYGAVPASADGCEGGWNDFNGDGFTDIAIGDPAATVNGKAQAGAVRLIYGHGVAPQTFTQGMGMVGETAETGDGFGTNVQLGDIDWDQCVDLIVGVPSEDVGTAKDAGVVHVVHGSPAGLGKGKAPSVWKQGGSGFAGGAEAGDRFGAAISYGKDRVGYPHLLIGVPGEDLSSKKDAGMAYSRHHYGRASDGRTVLGTFALTQDTAGVDGAAESGDQFGASVAGISVIGAPGEAIGSKSAAGVVHVFRSMGPTLDEYVVSQDLSTVSGAAESGDRFGASLSVTQPDWGPDLSDRLAIGVPGEDLGAAKDAGMVHGLSLGRTSAKEVLAVSQDSTGVDDKTESGDMFGQTVHAANVGQGSDKLIVAVGVTGEDSGAGVVQVFPMSGAPGSADVLLRQGQDGITSGTPEAGDHFGAAFTESSQTLLIGAPDDVTHSEGIVHGVPMALFRGGTGTPSTWLPGQDGIPTGGARFGASLS